MHVTVEHFQDTKGFFSSTTVYGVRVLIELTDAERAVADKPSVRDHPMIKYQDGGYTSVVTLENFCCRGPFKRTFSTIGEAKNYEVELKTKLLPELKSILDYNATPGPSKQTFDL
jgi:hypothetical protein